MAAPRLAAHREQGYVLLTVVILLGVLSVVVSQFLSRAVQATQTAGYGRDSSESLLLAESAMNMLYGQFVFDGDLNGDGVADREQRPNLAASPAAVPLGYMFYIAGSGPGIEATDPGLLQRVADGEAWAQGANITTQAVASAAARIEVNDLFGNGFSPVLFVQDNNGDIVRANTTWDNTRGPRKAAAWLELVRNEDPDSGGSVKVYVEAVGQVGHAKSYVQRYIGEYSNTLGTNVGALNEANPAWNPNAPRGNNDS